MTNIKTKWNKLKYWQKGAIIGLPIGIILTTIMMIGDRLGPNVEGLFTLTEIIFIIPGIVSLYIFPIDVYGPLEVSFIILFYPFFFVLIGVLIGLHIGKVKGR